MKPIFFVTLCALLLVGCQFLAEAKPINEPPTVQIISPASNARIPTGKEVEIKSVATDESFIERVELYVNDDLIRIDSPPIKGGQVTFTVLQRWVPIQAGLVNVRVIAYDADGATSHPVGITLEAVGEALAELQPTKIATQTAIPIATLTSTSLPPSPSPTSSPLPTSTPSPSPPPTSTPPPPPPPSPTLVPPTATPLPQIGGSVTNYGPLNIRYGPNEGTAQLGWLNPGDFVLGIARNRAGNWAKIRYGPNNREGWVFALRVAWTRDFKILPIE